MINALAIIFTILLCAKASAVQIYTMKDLNVLYEQKAYKEYLAHALDIRPSLRNKKWRELTTKMASDYVSSLINKGVSTYNGFKYIENLTNIPILKKDDFFQLKRTQYAYSYFKSCTKETCRKEFKEFWRTAKHYPDYDFKFYELFRLKDSRTTNYILPYFTKSSGSEFYCKKGHVVNDLVRILETELRLTRIGKSKEVILKFADKDCISSLSKQITESLLSLKKSNMKKITLYKILKSNNLISNSDEDLFFATYILQGPIVGEVFNLAWNRIIKVSQTYKRREKLLRRMLSMDPLPGEVFAHPDTSKRDTLIKFFHRNFPEYLEGYVKTCINYYSGAVEHPYGNPTIHCDSLMKATKKRPWIQDHLKIKYSGSKKF